jgi:putative ABC transport system permease protein
MLRRPELQTQQKRTVEMTAKKLVFKELCQRPTAMITCLLAIVLGVTALVAIRSVTLFSEEEVAKQMTALGANVLLVPKDVSLQDYYAADTNGTTLPEENATQLAMAGLAGVEHIAPKLNVPVEINGHQITLTGILPQSAYEAQASWQGLQVFNKSCGSSSCKSRAKIDDETTTATESLAKGRFVHDIAADEVIVGADAAEATSALTLAPGDSVELLGQKFRVAGVMPPTGTVDDSRIFAHLHEVQLLSKSGEKVNVIEIIACCEDAAGGLVNELRSMFPDAKVLTISQVVDTQVAVNRLMKNLSYLFFAILLVVGIASIAGTMFANVAERRREIGTLMALGATPSLVSRLFLGKALLVGIVGGAIGYAVGTALAIGFGPYWAGISVRPVPSLAAISIFVAAAVALAASYFPARRASLTDPCLCFREV